MAEEEEEAGEEEEEEVAEEVVDLHVPRRTVTLRSNNQDR